VHRQRSDDRVRGDVAAAGWISIEVNRGDRSEFGLGMR